MLCENQTFNLSQEKADLSKTDVQSNHSKTSSNKLDNTTTIDSDNENGASIKMEEFEFFSDIDYDNEELEKCLLTDLLEALDGDNTTEEKTEKIVEAEIKEIDVPIKLNINEPSFVPKSFKQADEKPNEKELVLIKKNGMRKQMKKTPKKKKSQFNEREGDWCCFKCKNINFSFRVMCNRCKLSRSQSDKMAEEALDKVIEYFKNKS